MCHLDHFAFYDQTVTYLEAVSFLFAFIINKHLIILLALKLLYFTLNNWIEIDELHSNSESSLLFYPIN